MFISVDHHHSSFFLFKHQILIKYSFMFRSFWRSFDRFSLPHFKCIIDDLQGIEDVDTLNMEVVVDLLQSLVEIVTYGDKHDPSIFECFMEHQVLSDFVSMLEITRNSRFQAKVLQYLSIMIQNLQSEHAIYYCFSNGYINRIITHDYEFQDGNLVLYYVSLLRALGGKLNRDTISLLLEVQEGIVIAFPLYTEALKFAHHGEKMIQIAVRSLTLSIYNVSDEMVYQFLVTPPMSQHFSDVIHKLKEECSHLDATVSTMRNRCIIDKGSELFDGTDKLLDNIFYVKDLLCVGKSCLSNVVTEKLLALLVVPIIMQLMQLGKNGGVNISAVTSLYFLSRLLQVLDNKEMLDSVAFLVLYPHDADPQELDQKMLGRALEHKLSACHLVGLHRHSLQNRNGIFSYIFSDNLGLLLASLFLLLILAGSEGRDTLSSVSGSPKIETDDAVVSEPPEQSTFVGCMAQILNVLLNILGSTTPSPKTHWHVGWFVVKLINLQRSILSHQELYLFNVTIQLNPKEQRIFGFTTIGNRHNVIWRPLLLLPIRLVICLFKIAALEESSSNKDPFFILETATATATARKISDGNEIDAWQKMVDVVKIFVLHLQLKVYLTKGGLPDSQLSTLPSTSSINPSHKTHNDDSDFSVRFGSEVSLASGIPCKIAFSKLGLQDIFFIPVAKGISGKLLLVEKHPFHSRRGIVFATAPLAGLTPNIDEEQATWLHLHVRNLTPNHSTKKSDTNSFGCQKDAKWTLGFVDSKACEAASLVIAEETFKQRFSVESLLAPYLSDSYPAV